MLNPSLVPPPAVDVPNRWVVRDRVIDVSVPRVMAILNVTPDSFSDGSLHDTLVNARARAEEMVAEGADIIDVGGESTRPGGVPVSLATELSRVVPVVRAIRRDHPALPISVDTTKGDVARAVLDEGADIINDVSMLRFDPHIARVVAEARGGLVLMHSRGEPGELADYSHAEYGGDVVNAVAADLRRAIARAGEAGMDHASIVLDPGIGFSKRSRDSLQVLRELSRLLALGRPLLVGASRKRLVGELTGVRDPAGRDAGSLGVHLAALVGGARLFRVHAVRESRHALDCAWAILGPSADASPFGESGTGADERR